MPRPVLLVLAGVNGAGKSSIGGYLLEQQGLTWFNPDSFARELKAATGCDQGTANAAAWAEGFLRLERAIADRSTHAFETTLGGSTITETLLAATATHDVHVWYCGLTSADLHLARVRARVQAGGHDIPEDRIRERFVRAPLNLIRLLPKVAAVAVYDNSSEAGPRGVVPDPVRVLEVRNARVVWPKPADVDALLRTPVWAKPIVEAALNLAR